MTARGTTASAPGAWDAMLRAVLLPNRAARVVREDPDGSLALAVPTRRPPFLQGPLAWLVRTPRERLTLLDPLGASVWKSCDGRRTVDQLVVEFARRHRLSFHESRVSVTGYVTTLLRRGVLAVAVDPSR